MRFTYLLVDLFAVILPVLFSFHPKLKFYKTWSSFFPAVFITGLYFIIWDACFTNWGVWGFNFSYLTGATIGNLPLEEILFFVCIPYACVFTFHCLQNHIGNKVDPPVENLVTTGLIVFLTITGIFNYRHLYTVVTFLSLAVLLVVARYFLNIKWLLKFYLIYALLLIPFLIVNGILTGTGLKTPVVWYNEKEIIGIRILTIPFEDIFYGMELVLINLLIYRYLLSKNKSFKTEALSRADSFIEI